MMFECIHGYEDMKQGSILFSVAGVLLSKPLVLKKATIDTLLIVFFGNPM